jgi:ribosome-associated protein
MGTQNEEASETVVAKKPKEHLTDAPGDGEESSENSISKSQKKRDMLALQAVGAELVELSVDVIKRMELPDDLRVALLEAKAIPPSKHGGFKRQMQYIGRLMREVDSQPIIEQLAAQKAPSQRQTAQHHLAERWRERMLADVTAIGAFAREFEGADVAALEKLVADSKDDQAKQRPPKNYRVLYQTIHKLVVAKE